VCLTPFICICAYTSIFRLPHINEYKRILFVMHWKATIVHSKSFIFQFSNSFTLNQSNLCSIVQVPKIVQIFQSLENALQLFKIALIVPNKNEFSPFILSHVPQFVQSPPFNARFSSFPFLSPPKSMAKNKIYPKVTWGNPFSFQIAI
jgi:hypothetical protein